MENVMTEELSKFIDKLQKAGRELYEEYNSLSNSVWYTCELTNLMDRLYEFNLLEKKDTIK